jgi:hypothetical protein
MNASDFGKIGSGKTFGGGGEQLRDGKGKAVITKQSYTQTRAGMLFLTEFLVIENEAKEVLSPTTGELLKPAPNAVGSTFKDTQYTEGANAETCISSIRKIMNAALGKDEGQLNADQMNGACAAACGPENANRGRVVAFDTYRKKSKGGNGKEPHDYVVSNFSAVIQSADEVAAMRAELDSMDSVKKT